MTTQLNELSWRERAEAAERTAEVLKKRLRAIDAGVEKTLIQRQLEAGQRHAAEIARRRELSEMRSAELQRHSATLERQVAERTEQIRTILDHVSAGFLLVGPDLQVAPGWSRSCEQLLGARELGGRSLPELLGWPEARATEFALSATQVFDDILPEEVSTAQIPSRAKLGERDLALSFGAVRKDGAVVRLLATVIDVTPQIAAERAARHHERLVHILSQRDAFLMFLGDARRQLQDAREGVQQDDKVFVRRAVHTVKGNSATFGLDEVVEACHAAEEHALIGERELDGIASQLRAFLERSFTVLHIDPEPSSELAPTYALTQHDLDALTRSARSNDPRALATLMAHLRRRPAREFVEPLRGAVVRLAERLGKDVDFSVSGGELAIDPVRLQPVLQCLPHLVRNAVDHGLEPPEERAGKPPRGRLGVAFRDDDANWEIEVSDDGRGIDSGRIASAALERAMIAADQVGGMRPSLAYHLITMDGFSTADEVTDVSGRGVGLGAVRSAVELLGGRFDIESVPHHGTRFRIRVPKLELHTPSLRPPAE